MDAEDLAQDVAITLLSHHTGPPDRDSFLGWCFGVARNLAAHRYRSETRRRKRTDDANLRRCTDRMLDDPESCAMVRERLATKLDSLDSRAVSLLHDRFVLEETSEEIADRLNVSSASIRMKLMRIIAILRTDERETPVHWARRAARARLGARGRARMLREQPLRSRRGRE
jgi:RNA polymerase sigma-70 factor, ECF subfamily